MNLGLQTFLAGVVDYAGLFPPARLPLEQAIRAYAHYAREDDAWMLGRFVCPAARLEDLTPLGQELFDGPPVLFSALGRGGATSEEFLTGLAADLQAVTAFRETLGSGVAVDAFESRLPSDAVANPETLTALLDAAEDLVKGRGLSVSYEMPGGADLAVAAACLRGRRGRGLKVRCGGLQPGDFPDNATLAHTLFVACETGVPLKATAGLHHPLPRQDAAIPAHMHGFVNLIAAGVLSRTCRLDEGELAALLAEDDPGAFRFSDEGLCWREHKATVRDIADARRGGITSFGSCSFDEPRADLRALGWL